MRKPIFPICVSKVVAAAFLRAKNLMIRNICWFLLLVSSPALVQAQSNMVQVRYVNTPGPELPSGVIQGQIRTTEGSPAASVTVLLRGTNKITTTNEQGFFLIKGV